MLAKTQNAAQPLPAFPWSRFAWVGGVPESQVSVQCLSFGPNHAIFAVASPARGTLSWEITPNKAWQFNRDAERGPYGYGFKIPAGNTVLTARFYPVHHVVLACMSLLGLTTLGALVCAKTEGMRVLRVPVFVCGLLVMSFVVIGSLNVRSLSPRELFGQEAVAVSK